MRVTLEEIRSLETFMQCVWESDPKSEKAEDAKIAGIFDFYADNPHFLMAMGFDEYVALKRKYQFEKHWVKKYIPDGTEGGATIYRKPSGQWLVFWSYPVVRKAGDDPVRKFLDCFQFFDNRTLNIDYDEREELGLGAAVAFSFEELLQKLYRLAGNVLDEEKTIWSPRLWAPREQANQTNILQRGTKRILTALKSEKKDLVDLSWKQLEEIVAEILRAQGLEIHVVRESPQGGRDIIARGELIPGEEPLTMAVEVKHKKVVDRPEVQLAIQQNKEFPALMFVTSGRFTAGVLREKKKADNQLRLFLKDGVALGDLIRDYKLER